MIKNMLTILITFFSNIEDKHEKVGLYIEELLNIEENKQQQQQQQQQQRLKSNWSLICYFKDSSVRRVFLPHFEMYRIMYGMMYGIM